MRSTRDEDLEREIQALRSAIGNRIFLGGFLAFSAGITLTAARDPAELGLLHAIWLVCLAVAGGCCGYLTTGRLQDEVALREEALQYRRGLLEASELISGLQTRVAEQQSEKLALERELEMKNEEIRRLRAANRRLPGRTIDGY